MDSIVIGLVAGAVCYYFVAVLKVKFGYDDSLDAFGVHGIGGSVGALLTGVFAREAVGGAPGLLESNPGQFVNNALGAGVTWVLAAVATIIILVIVDKIIGSSRERDGGDYWPRPHSARRRSLSAITGG